MKYNYLQVEYVEVTEQLSNTLMEELMLLCQLKR
jgi:hypothetical protein